MYYRQYVWESNEWWIYDKFDIFICTCTNPDTTEWLLSILNKL
jgi:hypothetical protein